MVDDSSRDRSASDIDNIDYVTYPCSASVDRQKR